MLKKYISFLIVVLLLFSLCGCNTKDITTSDISVQNQDKFRTVTMQEYGVSFEVPNDWYVDMEDASVDMFCTNDKLNMAVFGYFTEDFSDDADYLEVWEAQNESVLEQHKNVRKMGHTPEFDAQDKEYETILYSSEIKDVKQYSYFVFVKPKENPKAFLWIAFTSIPSSMRDEFDVLEDIVDSIQFN